MLKINLLLSAIALSFNCCSAQEFTIVDKSEQVELFDLLWKMDENNIKTVNSESDYFYRLFITQLDQENSRLEGEVLDQPYLLIGEYGENPDGILYKLESCYGFEVISFDVNDLIFEYGTNIDRKEKNIDLKPISRIIED